MQNMTWTGCTGSWLAPDKKSKLLLYSERYFCSPCMCHGYRLGCRSGNQSGNLMVAWHGVGGGGSYKGIIQQLRMQASNQTLSVGSLIVWSPVSWVITGKFAIPYESGKFCEGRRWDVTKHRSNIVTLCYSVTVKMHLLNRDSGAGPAVTRPMFKELTFARNKLLKPFSGQWCNWLTKLHICWKFNTQQSFTWTVQTTHNKGVCLQDV